MSEIRAKSKRKTTLNHHVSGLFEQFEHLKNSIKNKSFFSDYDVLIKYAIFAHDLGKVAPSFQYQLGNINYSPKVGFPVIPHSIYSLVWIDEKVLEQKLREELKNKFEPEDKKIVMNSVAFHHWRDNFELIISGNSNDVKEIGEKLIEDSELKDRLLENLKNEMKGFENEKYIPLIAFNEDINYSLAEGDSLLEYVTPPYGSYFLPQKIIDNNLTLQKKQICVLGTLMRVDHFASYVQDEGLDISPEQKVAFKVEKDVTQYETIIERFIESFDESKRKNLWQIDKIKDSKEKNVILVAPTGIGKTEYAYLWGSGEKIFFTLPLRSAVNSIYERSCKIFNDEKIENKDKENSDYSYLSNVCLLHSDSDVYLSEKTTNFEGENIRIKEMSRHLSYPVIVSTGDQIFPYALKSPGYEKIYSTLAYSRLIIDEVQAYNPEAIAVIVKLIEDINILGGKFLLMTATLPKFIEDEIKKRIKIDNLYEENLYTGLENIEKHKIQIRNKNISDLANSKNSELMEEIINKAKDGKRVLILVNKVEKSQEIYENFKKNLPKEISLDLLHSRFTMNDRIKNENEIIEQKFKNPKEDNIGRILVSTQVIEASVDIDADILYTEICPLDSLIQRMGRIRRRDRAEFGKEIIYGDKEPANVIVFFNNDKTKKNFSIESGNGRVYENEILILSLCLLFEKTGIFDRPKIEELMNKLSKDKEKWFDKVISDSLPKKSHNNYFYELKPITESEKKKIVEDLYELVGKNENSSYIKKFNQNLAILDSGYTSENKREAQKFFRDISSVPAIASSEIEKFVKEIKNLIDEYSTDRDKKLSYLEFKKRIVANFIVNIDASRVFRQDNFHVEDLSSIIEDIYINIDDKNEKEILSRISKWLKNTYKFSGSYDNKSGAKFSDKNLSSGSSFL